MELDLNFVHNKPVIPIQKSNKVKAVTKISSKRNISSIDKEETDLTEVNPIKKKKNSKIEIFKKNADLIEKTETSRKNQDDAPDELIQIISNDNGNKNLLLNSFDLKKLITNIYKYLEDSPLSIMKGSNNIDIPDYEDILLSTTSLGEFEIDYLKPTGNVIPPSNLSQNIEISIHDESDVKCGKDYYENIDINNISFSEYTNSFPDENELMDT